MKATLAKFAFGFLTTILITGNALAIGDHSIGEFAPRDPRTLQIIQRNEPNLYGFVRNDPINSIDLFGLRTVTINVYYKNSLPLNAAVQNEVNRILQNCVKKCVACDKGGKAKHSVQLKWIETTKKASEIKMGRHGGVAGFGTTSYNAHAHGDLRYPAWGSTGGNDIALNPGLIKQESSEQGIDYNKAVATTIAHELFYHAMSLIGRTDQAGNYVDSSPGRVGGELSPSTCKGLCDYLDID